MNSEDRFLTWASERGTGSWEAFCEAHSWLFQDGDRGTGSTGRRPSWTASLLASQGHLEVVWGNKWSVAPPCLVGIPSAGGAAVLTGARPTRLVEQLRRESENEDFDEIVVTEYVPQEGPTVFYVQYGSMEELGRFAGILGLGFERYTAERLSRILPPIADVIKNCPTTPVLPTGYSIEHLDPTSARWIPMDGWVPGLFKFRSFRDQYRLFDGSQFREVDKDWGAWASFALVNSRQLLYQPEIGSGTLVAPATCRLPAIYARAAVLCSGLPPVFDPRTSTIRYLNVPFAIASRIARGLDQPEPSVR